MNYFEEAQKTMTDLYGKDVVMSLATVDNTNSAGIRNVDAYYNEGIFYVTTYGLSCKMIDIAQNPSVALCHNLFVARGKGENIGNPLEPENAEIRETLKKVFSAFYDKHVNESDENTCILKIKLNDALLFANNYKYRVDFTNKTAIREDFIVDIPL